MILTAMFVALAAALFWAAAHTPPHPSLFRYWARSGAVVLLALAGFTGYFAWSERRMMGKLAQLIDPVPQISGVTAVPSAAQLSAIARFMAAVPLSGPLTSSVEQRRDLARRLSQRRTDYWILTTRLPAESVFAFYRRVAVHRGWTIATDAPPWLMLSRGEETLFLFVTDDWPRPGIKVLYGASPAPD